MIRSKNRRSDSPLTRLLAAPALLAILSAAAPAQTFGWTDFTVGDDAYGMPALQGPFVLRALSESEAEELVTLCNETVHEFVFQEEWSEDGAQYFLDGPLRSVGFHQGSTANDIPFFLDVFAFGEIDVAAIPGMEPNVLDALEDAGFRWFNFEAVLGSDLGVAEISGAVHQWGPGYETVDFHQTLIPLSLAHQPMVLHEAQGTAGDSPFWVGSPRSSAFRIHTAAMDELGLLDAMTAVAAVPVETVFTLIDKDVEVSGGDAGSIEDCYQDYLEAKAAAAQAFADAVAAAQDAFTEAEVGSLIDHAACLAEADEQHSSCELAAHISHPGYIFDPILGMIPVDDSAALAAALAQCTSEYQGSVSDCDQAQLDALNARVQAYNDAFDQAMDDYQDALNDALQAFLDCVLALQGKVDNCVDVDLEVEGTVLRMPN